MSNKPKSLLAQLKERAKNQKEYGGKTKEESAKISTRTCKNCGAPRGASTGVTRCAYCGFTFVEKELSDSINLKKTDNSSQ